MAKYQKFPSSKDGWAAIRRVNLVHYLEQNHGFVVDKKATSQKNNGNLLPVMGHNYGVEMHVPGENGKKSAFLVVKRGLDGGYFFASSNIGIEGGTIVDFIGHKYGLDPHHKPDGAKIAKLVTDFDATLKTIEIPKYVAPEPLPVKDRNAIIARFYNMLKGFKSPEYLMARGLDRETIYAKEFDKRIFNSIYKDPETGELITNTLFPLIDKNDNLCGIEYKNYKRTGLNSHSDRLLWKSNVLAENGIVKEIVIGEAQIDLLSYAELNDKLGKNILFISHVGNLYDLQIQAIQELINKHQPEKITLATDRDLAGQRYDTNFIGQLINPKGQPIENDFKAKSQLSGTNVILTINLSFEKILQGKTKVNDILTKFKNFNTKDRIIFDFKENAVSYGNNSAKIVIEFENKEIPVNAAQSVVMSERMMQSFIKIDKPTGADLKGNKIEDWNQKLMTSKKIKKEDIKKIMDKLQNNEGTEKVLLANAFSPKDFVINFIKEWNNEMLKPIKEAVQAGVSQQLVSNLVTKAQLVSFDKYTEATERNLEEKNPLIAQFLDYRKLLTDEIANSDGQLKKLNNELNSLTKYLDFVKSTLNFEGDSLSPEKFNELTETQKELTKQYNALRKQTGTFNEFSDGAKLKDLEMAATKMSNKQWERIVRSQLNLPLRLPKITEETAQEVKKGVSL